MGLLTDLRYALRTLRRNPTFAGIVVLTLAFSIGANTAIFAVVNAVLIRPLPYFHSEKLAWIGRTGPTGESESATGGNYLDWRAQSKSFEQLTAFFASESFNLTGHGSPARIHAARISNNFLQVFEILPSAGRAFTPDEDRPNGNPVAIITQRLWDERFGQQTGLSSQTVTLDGKAYTVVGILAPDFRFPEHPDLDLLIPLALDPIQEHGQEQSSAVEVVGRLRADVPFDKASAELTTILQQNGTAGAQAGFARILSLHEHLVGQVRPAILLLFLAATLLLLIGCINLASLLLARFVARHDEFAIRFSLGASRMRVVRQILAETGTLGLVGGGVGLVMGTLALKLLLRILPGGAFATFLEQHGVGTDWRILVFTFGLSLASGIMFGLLAALLGAQVNLNDWLKEGGPTATVSILRNRFRNLLVFSEVSLTLVLLIVAGLLLKSLYRLVQVDPGFRPENVLTFKVQVPASKYSEHPQRQSFFEQLLTKASHLPGVESVGMSSSLPLSGNSIVLFALRTEGQQPHRGEVRPVNMIYASPDYFSAVGTRLLRGRYFTDHDNTDSPPVAIISAALAQHFWGTQDPIGKRLKRGPSANWQTVVGVVEDVHHDGLDVEPGMTLYTPVVLSDLGDAYDVAVRSQVDPASLSESVRMIVTAMDPELPLYSASSLQAKLASSISSRQFNAVVLSIFAGLALVLAAVGIFGVLSFNVVQRTREMGIRLALGAEPRNLLKLLIFEEMKVVFLGIAVGTFAAIAATPLARSFLFEVNATDPATFLIAAITLGAIGSTTCYMTARRVLKVDPVRTLRYQ